MKLGDRNRRVTWGGETDEERYMGRPWEREEEES